MEQTIIDDEIKPQKRRANSTAVVQSVVQAEIERNQRNHMPSKGNQSGLAIVGPMVGCVGFACCVAGWLREVRRDG